MYSRLFDRRTGGLLAAALLALSPYAPDAAADGSSPAATIIPVSTEAQLQSAVQSLRSNTTIVLAPGTYQLTSTLWIRGPLTDVGIRGATGNFDDVRLVGPGMSRASYGDVPDGIATLGDVQGLTVANLTIRDIYSDAIAFSAGTARPHIANVHVVDAGESFIASAGDGPAGVTGAVVEGSIFEFTTTARDRSVVGIAISGGADWTIRDNTFRNIVGPSRQVAGPALALTRGARTTVTERNWFINVSAGVAYGLYEAPGFDHAGGVIRNNFFFRAADQIGGSAIALAAARDEAVVNNTVYLSGTSGASIEYRFPETTGVLIANNLVDGIIAASDGATATEMNNLVGGSADLFLNAAAGDLRLNPSAVGAIDRGITIAAVTDDWAQRLRPAGRAYDIGADEYGAERTSYGISGRVIDAASGAGIGGVTVQLSGARTQTSTTDGSGTFSFTGLAGRVDYTATASASGQIITPSSLFFPSLVRNQGAADFTSRPEADTPRVDTMANHAPTVTITYPANGDVFTAPAAITVTATAHDRDTYVAKVAFYAGSVLIGTDTSGPFKAKWSSIPAGTYTLTAIATDSKGLSTTSSPITIQVNAAATATANQPPTVSLTAPASGAVYAAPASVTVSANASDADGSISKVDFYAGSSIIGTKTASPYSVTWSGMAAGTYSLTAVATDNAGATTRSSAISVTVNADSTSPTAPQTGVWVPPLSTSWQWQLTTPVDQTVDVAMYDIDMFDNDASVVSALHAKGRKVICYISAGTFENWRPDAALFPDSVKGNSNGWAGEKWLDIRRLDILGPILSARMDLCKQKGFDGIEPDNVDGYTNKTGFPLTAQDQLTFNTWLASAAHARGLSVGLKNDIDQASQLVGSFDWALNEQCFEYNECSTLAPFTKAGKAVFEVEYNLSTSQFCPQAVSLQFNSMKKNLDLDAPRTACTP